MKLRIYLYFIFLMLISSCKGTHSEEWLKKQVESVLTQRMSFVKIEEISLEKTSKWDTSFLYSIKLSKDYIFARAHNGLLHVWKRDGSYVGQAGSWGKGPGEYRSAYLLFFLSDSLIGCVDDARRVINVYEIKNEKIRFIDQYDISRLRKFGPNSIKASKDFLFFNCCTGSFDNDPRVIKVDKKVFTEGKPLETGKTYFNLYLIKKAIGYSNVVDNFCVSDKSVFFRDITEKSGSSGLSKFASSYIYVGNQKGGPLKKINAGINLSRFCIDKTEQVLLVQTLNKTGLVEIAYSLQSGELLYDVKNSLEKEFRESVLKRKNRDHPVIESFDGPGNSIYIIAEPILDDDKTCAILHICEVDLGLGEDQGGHK